MIEPKLEDIGRAVIYKQPHLPKGESGVITSFNKYYVFVRYGSDIQSKGTYRRHLSWAGKDPAVHCKDCGYKLSECDSLDGMTGAPGKCPQCGGEWDK